MVEQSPEHADHSNGRWKDTAAVIGGCLLYIVLGFGGVFLVVLLVQGTDWLDQHVYPWLIVADALALFLLVPTSLILAIFKKSRGIGGLGISISSYVFGLSIWVWCLIVAHALAGNYWLIIGVLLGGIGIVPISFVAALVSQQWILAGTILLSVVAVYAIRGLGNFLIGSYDAIPAETHIIDNLLDGEHLTQESMTPQLAEEMMNNLGDLLIRLGDGSHNRILDARLLPYSKDRIKEACECMLEYCEDLRISDPDTYEKLMYKQFYDFAFHMRFLQLDLFYDIDEEDSLFVQELNRRWDEVEGRIKQGTASRVDLSWMELARAMRQKYREREENFTHLFNQNPAQS